MSKENSHKPAAYLYRDEPQFDGNCWSSQLRATTDYKLAKFKSAGGEPIPLYASPMPAQQSPLVSVPDWFLAKDKLPSPDETVWVCVKNKNKDGGIWLHDTCSHDGDKWTKRANTWEDIVAWAYPVYPFSNATPSPRITEQDAPIALTTEQIEVLGRPNFACSSIARILVNKGFYAEIPPRSENEQAVAIHFMSSMLEKYGSNWKIEAEKVLNKLNAKSESSKEVDHHPV